MSIVEEGSFTSDESDNSPFLNLPEEVFLHICSFLQIEDLFQGLSRVCKKFYEILQQDSIYKLRISGRWKRQYLTVTPREELDWKVVCYHLEREHKLGTQEKELQTNVTVHYSNVDAVLFVNNGTRCFSGSRDRSINVWSFTDSEGNLNAPVVVAGDLSAHNGWVWRLCSFQDRVYSASWDMTIKEWAFQQDLVSNATFKFEAPVLCLTSDERGLIYGGCYNRTITAFDPRSSPNPIHTFVAHNSTVLSLCSSGNNLMSGGEDKSVALWDSRTRSLRNRCKLSGKRYPTWAQVSGNDLYVGDSTGYLHLYGFGKEKLALHSTHQVHEMGISALKVTQGTVWTASHCGWINCSMLLRPPIKVWSSNELNCAASGMDYCNGRLTVGTSSCIGFWLPIEN